MYDGCNFVITNEQNNNVNISQRASVDKWSNDHNKPTDTN